MNEVADEIYFDRVVKDGRVAVLISPNYGAGWSTWDDEYGSALLFDPWIVDILTSNEITDNEKTQRILTYCALKYPNLYTGGVNNLIVCWVPQGAMFRVTEHDGKETIELRDNISWITA